MICQLIPYLRLLSNSFLTWFCLGLRYLYRTAALSPFLDRLVLLLFVRHFSHSRIIFSSGSESSGAKAGKLLSIPCGLCNVFYKSTIHYGLCNNVKFPKGANRFFSLSSSSSLNRFPFYFILCLVYLF